VRDVPCAAGVCAACPFLQSSCGPKVKGRARLLVGCGQGRRSAGVELRGALQQREGTRRCRCTTENRGQRGPGSGSGARLHLGAWSRAMSRARRWSAVGSVPASMQHDDVPGRRCCTSLWPLLLFVPSHSAPLAPSRFTSVLPAIARFDTAHCTQHDTTMRPSSSLLRAFARASAPRPLTASPAEHIPAPAKRLLHTCTLRTSPVIRPSPVLSRARALPARRFESSSAAPTPPTTSTKAPESRLDREQIPSYELTFTCNVCKTRSSHRMSKQGYHKGTILISCPDCKNRHLISDHLKVR
jgi:hypothetical protein